MDALDFLDRFSLLTRRLRSRMRIGELSRRPLEILRMEMLTNARQVSCDWLIRPIDPWDETMPESTRAKLQSQQVLHDALAMRGVIFRRFPAIQTIELRAFRDGSRGVHELVLAGSMRRGDEVPTSIPSLAMRAHLSGFQFVQVDGVLNALPYEGLRYSHKR